MKNLTYILLLIIISFSACKNTKKDQGEILQFMKEEFVDKPGNININRVTHGKIIDGSGNVLHYTFDEVTHEAVLVINGEVIEMVIDTAEFSGTSYRNDRYSFTDWNGEVELRKDGEIIFTHKENTESRTFRGQNGKDLNVVYNNSSGTATLWYEGNEIMLKQDSVASGIQYSNSMYELREHQGKGELLKEGKLIFTYRLR